MSLWTFFKFQCCNRIYGTQALYCKSQTWITMSTSWLMANTWWGGELPEIPYCSESGDPGEHVQETVGLFKLFAHSFYMSRGVYWCTWIWANPYSSWVMPKKLNLTKTGSRAPGLKNWLMGHILMSLWTFFKFQCCNRIYVTQALYSKSETLITMNTSWVMANNGKFQGKMSLKCAQISVYAV